jgi:hypothetical protein
VSSRMSTLSLESVRRLPMAARLCSTGLVLTAAGMLLQITSGSTLYPSLTGPIVLLAVAVFVVFGPGRWTPYVGLVVPLVLGLGAIVVAVMTGEFVDQLTNTGRPGILLGSLLHALGLVAAVGGGVGMLLGRREAAAHER